MREEKWKTPKKTERFEICMQAHLLSKAYAGVMTHHYAGLWNLTACFVVQVCKWLSCFIFKMLKMKQLSHIIWYEIIYIYTFVYILKQNTHLITDKNFPLKLSGKISLWEFSLHVFNSFSAGDHVFSTQACHAKVWRSDVFQLHQADVCYAGHVSLNLSTSIWSEVALEVDSMHWVSTEFVVSRFLVSIINETQMFQRGFVCNISHLLQSNAARLWEHKVRSLLWENINIKKTQVSLDVCLSPIC